MSLPAPLFVPAGYSPVRRSIGGSATQDLAGAWVARAGFVLLGCAVIALAARGVPSWSAPARWAHGVFGLAMVAAAIWSHAPWDGGREEVRAGAGAIVGVATVAARRPAPRGGPRRSTSPR